MVETSPSSLSHYVPSEWDVRIISGTDWNEDFTRTLAMLAHTAAYPNPYYSPRVLSASTLYRDNAIQLKLMCVFKLGRLLAVLPFHERGSWTGLRKIPSAWTTPFTMSSLPLVSPEDMMTSLDILVRAMGEWHPRGWRFPLLPEGNLVSSSFERMAKQAGFGWHILDRSERAVLDQRPTFEGYEDQCISKKRRKDLKRNRNNLMKHGQLVYEVVTDPKEIKQAYDQYVAIEASGWKGRKRTALASKPGASAWGEAVFTHDENGPAVRIDRLMLDKKPVAVSLALVQQETIFTLKTTYDENHARYSPGLLLEEDMIRDFLTRKTARRMDSASLPGGIVESFWADRQTISDVLIVTQTAPSEEYVETLLQQEATRKQFLKKLKKIYHLARSLKN